MSDLHFLGGYRIECVLGCGAMGMVYKALDPDNTHHVAIKTIHRSFLNTDLGKEVLARFQKEADSHHFLRHSNIAVTLLAGQIDNVHCKIMEYVEGKDLKTLLADKKSFSTDEIINIVDKLLSALSCAHDEGFVHGYIKPANVIVGPNGIVKVTDFGMARIDSSTSTIASTIFATANYMSPEQCKGEKVDGRSDLFSVGIVLYELLAAQKPFDGDHSAIIMANIINTEPAPPSRLNHGIPTNFDAIVRKALEKDVRRRYQSAREFREDLLAINTKTAIQSSSPPQSIGKYRIESVLGEGAMGVVYKAYDPGLDRYVAIKTIRKQLLDTSLGQAMLERFRNEAKLASRLVHPNIVAIYEFDQDNEIPYFVMEYVDGLNLQTALKRGNTYSLEKIVQILDPVLRGLAYTHEFGIVHRDIKPGNIFISKKGVVKVSDFSIARTDNSSLTQIGTVVGTPSYMSPEQCMGGVVDGRSDLFSVGVMLYELVADQKPFVGDNYSSIMYQVVNVEPLLPSKINQQLPKGVDGIIEKALAKNPDDRFESADEFRQALAKLITSEPIKPPPQPPRRSYAPKLLTGSFVALAIYGFYAFQPLQYLHEDNPIRALAFAVVEPPNSDLKPVVTEAKPLEVVRTPLLTQDNASTPASTPTPTPSTSAPPLTIATPLANALPSTQLTSTDTPPKPEIKKDAEVKLPAPISDKPPKRLKVEEGAPRSIQVDSAVSAAESTRYTIDRIIDESTAAASRGDRGEAIDLLEEALLKHAKGETAKRVISVHLLNFYEDDIEEAFAVRNVEAAQRIVSKMRTLGVSSSIVAGYEKKTLMLDLNVEAEKESVSESAAREAERATFRDRELLSQEPFDELMIH